MIIHIQPDEGITLHFGAKIPGPIVNMGAVDMDFNYVEHFGEQISTGYERLLFDCMTGDATLFQRADMVEASWRIVSPILDVWQAIPARDFPNYEAGTLGTEGTNAGREFGEIQWKKIEKYFAAVLVSAICFRLETLLEINFMIKIFSDPNELHHYAAE